MPHRSDARRRHDKRRTVPWRAPCHARRRTLGRLESGTTKNGEARTLPYGALPELEEVIEAAWEEHERLAAAGVLCPFRLPPWRQADPIRGWSSVAGYCRMRWFSLVN